MRISLRFVLTSLLAVILNAACGGPTTPTLEKETSSADEALQNGTDIASSEFPQVVTVGGCSAELVSSGWIISASHCLAPYVSNPTAMTVTAGSETRNLTTISLPTGWVSGDLSTDLALGQLNAPITDITPIPLFQGYLLSSEQVTLVGFGIDTPAGNAKRTGTMNMSLSAIPATFTDGTRPDILQMVPDATNVGPCSGDSGGAVLTQVSGQNQLAGIIVAASYGGTGTCGSTDAGYAVNVAAYASWIQSTTGIGPQPYTSSVPTCTLSFTPSSITATSNTPTPYTFYPNIVPSSGAVPVEVLTLPSKTALTGSINVSPGVYTFEATVASAQDGQQGTCTGSVTVNPPAVQPTPTPVPVPTPTSKPVAPSCDLPKAQTGPNRQIKEGQKIILGDPPQTGTTYQWSGSNGRRASTARIEVSPASTTVFTLTAQNSCGSSSASVTVKVVK